MKVIKSPISPPSIVYIISYISGVFVLKFCKSYTSFTIAIVITNKKDIMPLFFLTNLFNKK